MSNTRPSDHMPDIVIAHKQLSCFSTTPKAMHHNKIEPLTYYFYLKIPRLLWTQTSTFAN